MSEAEHADLEEFVNAMFKLRADEFVAEKASPEKLKQYGLDKPESTWRFVAADKEALVLSIGKRDATDQRVYARLGAGDVVFYLDPTITARATAEYRKRALWTGFDASQVELLTISGPGGLFSLRKSEGGWIAAGKPEVKISQEAVTELLSSLVNLKAERFIRDKDAPLALYGLDKPRRTIVVQTGMGMRQELNLGNLQGGSSKTYAALPGKTEVILLGEADTAKLDKDLKGLSQK
jgi:hypothetical protein